MDLRQLRHFLAVVEHGSFLRAADVVHLTQPALSRSLQGLEAELNVRLLERGRRGVEPTPHGLLLVRHARKLVAQADETLAALLGLRREESLRLAIGVGTHLAGVALPRVVAGMVKELPRLAVSVQDGNAEELVGALQRGEIDVALCAWPAEGAPQELVFEEMLSGELVVVCGAEHPLARRRRISLEELSHRRWALAERPRAIGQVFRLAFTAAGLAPPEPVVRSTSMAFLPTLLQESDLLSLVPADYVEAALGDRRLVRIRTDLPSATARVGVMMRRGSDADATPVLSAFLEALRDELRKLRGGDSARRRRPAPR